MALGSVAMALTGALAGCGGSSAAKAPPVTAVPAVGGTVTVGVDQAPSGCNPNTASGDTVADQLVLSAVLPSAFVINAAGEAQYDSALIDQAELQSTSPETVVYTINPKAKWSDGTPITADDFIYAWQHQRAVPLAETGGDANVASTAGYDDISTMTKSDQGRTLTVVFGTPFADWQSLFSDLLPAHVLEQTGWSPPCTTVTPSIDLSGGPYEIASASSSVVTLVKNPHWWGEPPKVAKIVIRVAAGPAQLARWMYHHSIDVAAPSYFDPTFLQDITAMPSVKSSMAISNTFLELEFATTGTTTGSATMREGIAYAINRQDLTDKVASWADVAIAPATSHLYAQGEAAYPATPTPLPANSTTTTTSAVPSTSTTISPATFPAQSNPAKEARVLAAAGYERNLAGEWVDLSGHPLMLRLTVDDSDGWAIPTAALLVAQLRAQGFTVSTIPAASAQAAGENLTAGRADLALIPLHTTPFPTRTSAWYTPLLDLPGNTGAQDWSGYVSQSVDDLFTKAATKLDPVTAQPIYAEIDAQLWAHMVALPLFAEPTVLAWSASLTGITPGPYAPGLLSPVTDWARLVSEPSSYSGTPTLPGASDKSS